MSGDACVRPAGLVLERVRRGRLGGDGRTRCGGVVEEHHDVRGRREVDEIGVAVAVAGASEVGGFRHGWGLMGLDCLNGNAGEKHKI